MTLPNALTLALCSALLVASIALAEPAVVIEAPVPEMDCPACDEARCQALADSVCERTVAPGYWAATSCVEGR